MTKTAKMKATSRKAKPESSVFGLKSVTEAEVLKALYHEATYYGDGATHAARVSALKLLCACMGMIGKGSEAKGDEAVVFDINMINEKSCKAA